MSYSRLKHWSKNAPLLLRILLIWLILEVAGCLVVPSFIPRSWYLSWYLGKKGREETHRFLKGEAYLIPDEWCGWKNKPNANRENWIIDEHGARSTHLFTTQPAKSTRVVFLGSSMINGGMHISNNETISAFLETDDIEALNFGTMMYSVDQCLQAYRHRLHRYNARVVFVGLDGVPTAPLKNLYLPFRMQKEENMPYLKPRFELDGGSLRFINTPVEALLSRVPNSPVLLQFLSGHDSFYPQFETYCRFNLMPLSAMTRFTYYKLINLLNYFRHDLEGDQLLVAVMNEMVREAEKHGAQGIFLTLPTRRTCTRPGIYRFLPDVYQYYVNKLKNQGFNVVDIREIFYKCGQPFNQLFTADEVHYTPLANRIIAKALCPIITNISNIKSK
jgi:hypothetical protein